MPSMVGPTHTIEKRGSPSGFLCYSIMTQLQYRVPGNLTLFALLSWLSLRVSIQVLRVIRALLILPASLSLSPTLFVLDVLSDPARSTNESWEEIILVLSYREKKKSIVMFFSYM